MRTRLMLPLAALLVLVAVFGPAGQTRSKKTARVAMGYIPNVQFAPWYVAQAKGYFAKAGLEVEMDYKLDIDGLLLLSQGKKEFAIGGGDTVIIARSQGVPVTYVSTLYAKFPVSVVSLEASGIRTMEDLRGKKVGVPFMGTSYIALRAMLAKAGMQESDVKVEMIGYTQLASLLADKVDAAVCFANNEPVQLAVLGHKYNEIYSSQYFPLVGHGVVTSEKLLKEDPALVKAFARATIQGMQYTMDHPKEAFELIRKATNMPEKDAATQYKVLEASIRLWQNQYTMKNGLGKSDPASWAESQKILLELGFIKAETEVGKMMSNKYL